MPKRSNNPIARNCVKNNCISAKNTDMSQILIAPFDKPADEITLLFSYFLHKSPDITSVHSSEIPVLLHSTLFAQMMESSHFKYKKFCWPNAQIQKELDQGNLSGDVLCLKCKRFVCKRKQWQKGQPIETDFDCFLRHIRNSIAHGSVYYLHSERKTHIMFEDHNKSSNISARIVCVKNDLIQWKRILERHKKDNV